MAGDVEKRDTLLARLRAAHPERPARRLKDLVLHGLVKVDGVVETRPHAPAAENSTIEVARQPRKTEQPPLTIVYEDRDLVVIDKPANLLTTSARHEKDWTAYKILNRILGDKRPRAKALIVHRLDYATSGLLVFAKNHLIQEALKKQFEAQLAERGYVGVAKLSPLLQRDSGTLTHYLTEDKHLRVRAHRGKQPNSVVAVTRFFVERRNPARGIALVRFALETGKKNQIRVQMAAQGASIDGDRKYGQPPHVLPRLALHAGHLAFRHPRAGRSLRFDSPTPPEFLALFRV